MHRKRLGAAGMFLFLTAMLCLLGSCAGRDETEGENMYFLADNNVSGALTVYRCDGEHYYEVWSMEDDEDYVRVLDGDTLYYAPLFSINSAVYSTDLKTGKTKTFGELPDGMVKKLAVGKKAVYALMVHTVSENEGLYMIKTNREPKCIASCDNAPGMGLFCHNGEVYYYPDPSPGIQRYDEKNGKWEPIVEAIWECNEYAFCDGDFIYRRYSLDGSTIRRFPNAVTDTFFEQFNINTGEKLILKDYSPELSLFCAHDGWIYCTRRMDTPSDGRDSACKTYFTRLSPETGKEEILGLYEPREGHLIDYITFGNNGFVFSGYASSEENAEVGHTVYYYYPYGARGRIDLSFAETDSEKEKITVKTALSDKTVITEVELSDGELCFKDIAELAFENYDDKDEAYVCRHSGLVLDDFSLDRARYIGQGEAMQILNVYPEKWAFPKGCDVSLRDSCYFMPRFNLREDGKYDYDDYGMFWFYYQLGDNAYLTMYISPAPIYYSQVVSDYMISNLTSLRSRYGDMDSRIGDMPLSACYREDYGSKYAYYYACFTAGNAVYEITMGGVTQREFIDLLISIYASPRPETGDFFSHVLPDGT